MADGSAPHVPAGWYPDPWGSPQVRWWDGSAWTATMNDAPPAAETPAAAEPTPEPLLSFEDALAVPAEVTSRRARREHDAEQLLSTAQADSTAQTGSTAEAASAAEPDTPQPDSAPQPAITLQSDDLSQPVSTAQHVGTVQSLNISQPGTGEPFGATTDAPFAGAVQPAKDAPISPEPWSALAPLVFTDPEPSQTETVTPALAVLTVTAERTSAASAAVLAPKTPSPAAQTITGQATASPAAAIGTGIGTDTTSPPPTTPTPVNPPASAPAAGDDWAASLSNWEDIDTTAAPTGAAPLFGDAPAISYSQRAVKYQAMHGRTSAVWLIVFMPIIHLIAGFGSLLLFSGLILFDGSVESLVPSTSNLEALTDWATFAAGPLSVGFFVLTLVLGFQDRARLRLLGHNKTASPWWILLAPLIYLIVRSARVRACTDQRRSGPLTTYIYLYVVPPLIVIVVATVVSALDGALPI